MSVKHKHACVMQMQSQSGNARMNIKNVRTRGEERKGSTRTFVVAVLVLHLREEVWRGDGGEEVILCAERGDGDGSEQLRRPDAHLHQLARGPLHGHASRERLVARGAPAALPTETRRLPHANCARACACARALDRVAVSELTRSLCTHAAAVRLHAARRSRLRLRAGTVCRFASGARRRGSSPAAAAASCAAAAVCAARRTPVRRSAAVRGTCNRSTRYEYNKCTQYTKQATSTNEKAGARGNGTWNVRQHRERKSGRVADRAN